MSPNSIKIKRRVKVLNIDGRLIPGKFEEKLEEAQYITRTKKGHMVRLSNGKVIYRKDRDVVLQ